MVGKRRVEHVLLRDHPDQPVLVVHHRQAVEPVQAHQGGHLHHLGVGLDRAHRGAHDFADFHSGSLLFFGVVSVLVLSRSARRTRRCSRIITREARRSGASPRYTLTDGTAPERPGRAGAALRRKTGPSGRPAVTQRPGAQAPAELRTDPQIPTLGHRRQSPAASPRRCRNGASYPQITHSPSTAYPGSFPNILWLTDRVERIY